MLNKYLPIYELSKSGYELAVRAMREELLDGRYELENGAYAFISSYVTKPIIEGLFEAHKRFTDVQLILKGQEIIGVMPVDEMHVGTCVKPYEYDIELYKVNGGKLHTLNSGDFLILTSRDAHMPGISLSPQPVKKLVIKIPE